MLIKSRRCRSPRTTNRDEVGVRVPIPIREGTWQRLRVLPCECDSGHGDPGVELVAGFSSKVPYVEVFDVEGLQVGGRAGPVGGGGYPFPSRTRATAQPGQAGTPVVDGSARARSSGAGAHHARGRRAHRVEPDARHVDGVLARGQILTGGQAIGTPSHTTTDVRKKRKKRTKTLGPDHISLLSLSSHSAGSQPGKE